MSNVSSRGFGWHRSIPDFRDYCTDNPLVSNMLDRLQPLSSTHPRAPETIDLSEFFPEVGDQQCVESSTAFACADLVRYFEGRAHGRIVEPSVLFLHQVTRKLLGTTCDSSADLRTTLKAMVHFGMPPARYWPYNVNKLEEEPAAFHYSFANPYRSIRYVRLDARNRTGAETLGAVRSFLAAGFPCVFGFPVPSSISREGDVSYRPTYDTVCGGLAVVAVGYDDRRISNSRGALLFRNSWGRDWGENGYGWLPYSYIHEQLAADFWTLLRPDWLESDEFRRPPVMP